jgi:cobalamin transport system substrate-binding protein
VVWPNALIAPGRGTLINELIQRAGGESVTATEPLPYPRLSLETVVERRPDRIIVGRHGQESVEELPRGWERLGSVSAVREGRVYGVDGDLVHRPGPRMVEALRALARVIHPERVP